LSAFRIFSGLVLSLPKLLSDANAFEISGIEDIETEGR